MGHYAKAVQDLFKDTLETNIGVIEDPETKRVEINIFDPELKITGEQVLTLSLLFQIELSQIVLENAAVSKDLYGRGRHIKITAFGTALPDPAKLPACALKEPLRHPTEKLILDRGWSHPEE